jgi:hypothetical protein
MNQKEERVSYYHCPACGHVGPVVNGPTKGLHRCIDCHFEELSLVTGVPISQYEKNLNAFREKFTCYECPDNATCEFAWDAYNTDGDCLHMK